MKNRIIILSAFVVIVSCSSPKPKINRQTTIDSVAIVDDRMQDSTKMLVSDLPIRFDSTVVLLDTVGLVEFKRRGKYSKYSSTSYSSSDIASNYFKSDNFRGDFINIIFEDSSGRRLLTKNKITIKGGVFLRQLYDLTKQAYLL